MANLETLELTIQANAESATQGVGKLVHSLSFLSKEIGKNVGALKLLNSELSKLKKFGAIKMPTLSSATGATRTVSAAQRQAQAIEEWKKNRKPLTISHFRDNDRTEEEQRKLFPQWFNNYDSPEWQARIEANKAMEQQSARTIASTKAVKEAVDIPVSKLDALKMKLEGLDKAIDKSSAKGDMLAVATKRLSQISVADKIEKETAAMEDQGNRMGFLGRAYEGAKAHLQSFGKTLGKVGRIASTMLIRTALRSMMKAFSEAWSAAYEFSKGMGGDFAQSVDKVRGLISGTAINIVRTFAPAIQALLPVISAIASAIQYLCSVIQNLFSLLGMSSGLWGASTDSIQKYSKAAGGGSKANKEMLASFDELNVISQESGGGGGGAGGAAMAGFSDVISSEFNAITALLVGEGLVALGLILACTGHIGIGIGLIAVGAASIAKVLVEDWNKLPTDVQNTINKIMLIAGGALLAIGAILAFSGANIPLGIGLMLAGGLNLAAAVGLNWNTVKDKVTSVFNSIKDVAVAVWGTITKAAESAWNSVKTWWEDSGIGPKVRGIWGGISTFFKGLWEDVSKLAQNAWLAVGKWWKENVTDKVKKEGVWGGIKGFFEGLWTTISGAASKAWDEVKKWWESSGLGNLVRGLWNDVGNFLINTVWTPVKRAVTNAWDAVKKWWEDSGIGSALRDVWNSVLTFLKDTIWNPIKEVVTNAWTAVKDWWNNNIYRHFDEAWGFVRGIFESAFKPIKTALDWLKELLNLSGRTIQTTVEVVQTVTQKGSTSNNMASILVETGKKSDNIITRTASNIFGGLLNLFKAEGAFGIPQGEVFVAQEHGAELVGEINGKTSVANQGQIIEGISSGVERANAEQNALLREQNSLLRGILEKETSVRFGASAQFGRTVKQSLDMYSVVGG